MMRHTLYVTILGHAMNQKASRQSLTANEELQYQNSLCRIRVRQKGQLGSSPSTSVFPCQYHCSKSIYSPIIEGYMMITNETYLFTYLLTPWSRALLEKLIGLQLSKKFSEFYGTRRFITAFISACHLSLS
jgi:hypothetical protein